MRVDSFSASAVIAVYDAINDSNKKNFGKLSLPKMVNVSLNVSSSVKKLSSKAQVSSLKKGTSDELILGLSDITATAPLLIASETKSGKPRNGVETIETIL